MFIHSFIYSIHSSIHSTCYSLIHSFISNLFIYSFIHSSIYSTYYSSIYFSFIHSSIQFMHSIHSHTSCIILLFNSFIIDDSKVGHVCQVAFRCRQTWLQASYCASRLKTCATLRPVSLFSHQYLYFLLITWLGRVW